MKRPRFHRARIIFRQTIRQTLHRAPGLVKASPGLLTRALADIREKEYPVFVKPALKQFRDRFKLGSSSSEAGEDLADPGLVEEIFAGSTLPVIHLEEQHELGPWDAEGQVSPAAASLEANGEPAGEPNGEPAGEPNGEPAGEPNGEPAGEPNGELAGELTGELAGELTGSLSDGADTLEPGSGGQDETTSGAAGSAGTAKTGTTQPRPADGPKMHTMVEALPGGLLGDGGLSEFLAEDLQDLFTTTDYADPRTQALLKGRERVDVHELADELKEYARSIGAVSPAPRKR